MEILLNETISGKELEVIQSNEVKWKGESQFGILGQNRTGVTIFPQLLARHMLFIGSIGSGKSVTMYHLIDGLRSNATEDDIYIFFDAKGDYYKNFYAEGDYVISNDSESIKGAVHWNVFEDILSSKEEKRDEVIREIASSIFKEDIESSSSPIFAVGARDLFAAILTVHVRNIASEGEMWDHEKLIEWIRKATDTTIRNLLKNHQDMFWVRNYIRKDNSPQTTQSFLTHLYQNVFSIFSGEFKNAGNFSLTKAIKERGGKAVFLEYDIASGNVLRPFYTLILDLAMKNVLGEKEENVRGNIFFILDEFPLIPKLNYMDNALNFGRSLGVRVIAGIQNVGQVNHVYSEGLGNSILSGFGTIFAYRLFDEPSRSLVINRHGRSKRMLAYRSANGSKGVNEQIIDSYVIEDWDLTSLEVGQCIVSPFNGGPFVFYPVNYKKKGGN